MSREKRIVDQCIIPLVHDQRARWQAAARRKGAESEPDLAAWIGPILDAAADYERAVGRSAAEMLRLMVPVPLRPLMSRVPGTLAASAPHTAPLPASPGAGAPASPASIEPASLAPAGIIVPTVGVSAPLPSPLAAPALPAAPPPTSGEDRTPPSLPDGIG